MAKHTKSIMQDKEDGQCYLCRILHGDYSIKPVREEHHVIGGTANRRLSEKYGLKVYLDRITTSMARRRYTGVRKRRRYSIKKLRKHSRGHTQIWTSGRSSAGTI